MILSSTGFARTGETGTSGGGDPAHLTQAKEPKKEVPHLEMRHCLAMVSNIFHETNDQDPLADTTLFEKSLEVKNLNSNSARDFIDSYMTKKGYVDVYKKSHDSFAFNSSNLENHPIVQDPNRIALLKEKAKSRAETTLSLRREFIQTKLEIKALDAKFAPGSQYLNPKELKQIKDGHCTCEKLKVKEITSAAQKAKKEITNNESIKVLEPNEQPRVLTEDDLACEFVGA